MARRRSGYVFVRLSRKERVVQILQARADARRGLPDPRRDGGSVSLTTPHLSLLSRQGEDTIEAMREDAIKASATDREERGRLTRRLAVIDARMADIEGSLEAQHQTPVEPTRGAGEEALEASVLLARRGAEADRRLAPLRSELNGLQHERGQLLEQLAIVEERLAAIVFAAQSGAERFQSYTEARRELYLRTLSRRHPDGAAIAETSRPDFADQSWITDGNVHRVLSNKSQMTTVSAPSTSGE